MTVTILKKKKLPEVERTHGLTEFGKLGKVKVTTKKKKSSSGRKIRKAVQNKESLESSFRKFGN